MILALHDCLIFAKSHPEKPDIITLNSRVRGDLERFLFSGGVNVRSRFTRKGADYLEVATVTREQFVKAFSHYVSNLSHLTTVESCATDDLRRREVYKQLTQIPATDYGAFDLDGRLVNYNRGYPPDRGQEDTANMRFLYQYKQDEPID